MLHRRRIWLRRLAILLWVVGGLYCASLVRAEDIGTRLDFARDGDNVVAALEIQIPSGYHAYAHEAGDAGRPTELDFRLGGRQMNIWYPEGSAQRDFYDPDATVFVYDGTVTLFSLLPGDAPGGGYSARLSLLLCSKRQCIPITREMSGTLARAIPPVEQQPWGELWDKLSSHEGEQASQAMSEPSAPLPPPDNFPLRLAPRYDEASAEISGLGKALILGILAGLLLNAMPCVLPVLTFKLTGLLMLGGGGERTADLHLFRAHNLCFAAGIVTLFTALALLLGAADLMWGQLFQNQGVILVMLLLVVLLGLSMLGVFTLPVIDMKFAERASNPYLRSYLTGLVATFLATPCSGPLLGGVLGWAFTQPLLVLLLVFWAVGLGMALPYILFCVYPKLLYLLPRPGAWMQTCEQIIGFFLLGTGLYLFSILPVEKHVHVLIVALFVAFLGWLWGRFGSLTAPPRRRKILGCAEAALFVLACVWVLRPVAPIPGWRDFSPEYFTSQLGAKPMLLEFTADWCPNCKFVEATVLTNARLRKWQEQYGIEFVRVDLTSVNPWAMRLLEALGSKSIPLTAIFPSGDGASTPVVIRDVYGAERLERALRLAAGG